MYQKIISGYLFPAGAALTLIGVGGQLFKFPLSPYVFSLGAGILIFLSIKRMAEFRDADIRQRRLTRSGLFAALLLALAAYSMFTGSNLWVIAVLLYALSTLFLSFRNGENK